MKHLLFLALMALTFSLNAGAQNVITNDYGDDKNLNNNDNLQADDDNETVVPLGVFFATGGKDSYYGKNLYGLFVSDVTPNGIGMDMNFLSNFKFSDHETIFRWDLGINYSFKLWSQNKTKLLLTAAVGPNLTTYDEPKGDVDYDNMSYEELERLANSSSGGVEWKTKYEVGMFFNARLGVMVGKFYISAGYYMHNPKFKFKDIGNAFMASIGYDI